MRSAAVAHARPKGLSTARKAARQTSKREGGATRCSPAVASARCFERGAEWEQRALAARTGVLQSTVTKPASGRWFSWVRAALVCSAPLLQVTRRVCDVMPGMTVVNEAKHVHASARLIVLTNLHTLRLQRADTMHCRFCSAEASTGPCWRRFAGPQRAPRRAHCQAGSASWPPVGCHQHAAGHRLFAHAAGASMRG